MNRRAATTSIKNQKLDEQISRQINKQQNIFLHSQRNNIYIYIHIYIYIYLRELNMEYVPETNFEFEGRQIPNMK